MRTNGTIRGKKVEVSEAIRFQVLLEETQHNAGQTLRGLTAQEQRMADIRQALMGCMKRFLKGTATSLDGFKGIEQGLNRVAEELNQVGWAILGDAGDVKRLKEDIAKLEARSEVHAT